MAEAETSISAIKIMRIIWDFPPIFVILKMTCLVTLFDIKLFSKLSNWTTFGIFNELLSTQNVNVARIARNVEWDFFCDFQTPWGMQFSIIQSSCNLLSKKFSLSYAVVFGEVVWSLHEEQRSCVNFLLSCIYILHHLLECLESNRAHTEGSSSKKQMRFWRLQEQAAAGKDNLICKLNRKGSGSFCPPFLLKMKMENEFS